MKSKTITAEESNKLTGVSIVNGKVLFHGHKVIQINGSKINGTADDKLADWPTTVNGVIYSEQDVINLLQSLYEEIV